MNSVLAQGGENMINKIHFGKRVADFRRKLKLSQAELGERLGVSSQAVSKWETGAALPDIDLLLEMSKLYGVSINELLEDNSLIARIASRPYEARDGIAYFVPPTQQTDLDGLRWEKELREEGWVEINWRDHWGQSGGWADTEYGPNIFGERNKEQHLRMAQRMAEHGGVILDIGSGPGGGYMPCILQVDSSAQIIVSDMSHTVVEEWKKFLDKELDSPHLCYAAFDFCDIPFGDCTIDVVSDHSGIFNCIGDKSSALKEVYRVLKSGGLFISYCGFATKESIAALPEEVRQELMRDRPWVIENLYEETLLAGFKKIDSIIIDGWSSDETDSELGDWSRERNISLQFTDCIRICEK